MMNDYDDSEDYSSAFRARSNTWPLNRPDLAVPNCVSIDETLPEIDLEEDDLFTTNDNWATGLVDHDITSWDPLLNAHNQNQQFLNNNNTNNNNYRDISSTSNSSIHQHQQPQQQQQTLLNSSQAYTQPLQHQHLQSQPQHNASLENTNLMHQTPQQPSQIQHHHQTHPQQPQLQPQQQNHRHPTLNDSHCLDSDDHIQQLHHLRLDGGCQASTDQQQTQSHYLSAISSPLCIHSSVGALGNDNYHHISPDHHHLQHHHHHHHHHQPHHHNHNQHHQNLQHLTPARYDLEHQGDYDLNHPSLHHMTSSNLEQQSPNTNLLSTSLSTSGIGLSGDLEDLDNKVVDSTTILQNLNYSDQLTDQRQLQPQQHQPLQQEQVGDNTHLNNNNNINNTTVATKQQNSTSSSKTKLNTPRRNAWGNMSYADLISQAINSTNDKRLTLSEIYDWMVQHVPYFKDKGDSTSSAGWKNSVRHNLSLHSRFKRLQNEGTGKSSWWTINPEANIGKCARRRAASMEASKFEKKRGRAKKRAEAIRQGLSSYPSLTGSSLNGSGSNLNQSRSELSSEQSGQIQTQLTPYDGISSENLEGNLSFNSDWIISATSC